MSAMRESALALLVLAFGACDRPVIEASGRGLGVECQADVQCGAGLTCQAPSVQAESEPACAAGLGQLTSPICVRL